MTSVQNGSGAHDASYPMGTGGLSLGVKQPRCEADHSHLHLVQSLRMCGAIPLLPQYASMPWCLVKRRDNFTFTFHLTDHV
jgi:hypothetical protein